MKHAFLLAGLCLLIAAGCSEDIVNEPDYVRVDILQPEDGQTVRDSVLRVITSLEKNCGCVARVEFSIDGILAAVDSTPAYYFDWNIREVHGVHEIIARGVVEGRAEGSDTIRVTINP